MTDIRPGMAVHLVKMPDRPLPLPQPPGMQGFGAQHISDYVKLGDIGTVVGHELARSEEPKYQVKFKDCNFWLAREHIEPTSPLGVKIEQPFVREDGPYWVKDEVEGWVPAKWGEYFNDRKWFYPGSDIPYDDHHFEEIGPRVEEPEGLE